MLCFGMRFGCPRDIHTTSASRADGVLRNRIRLPARHPHNSMKPRGSNSPRPGMDEVYKRSSSFAMSPAGQRPKSIHKAMVGGEQGVVLSRAISVHCPEPAVRMTIQRLGRSDQKVGWTREARRIRFDEGLV